MAPSQPGPDLNAGADVGTIAAPEITPPALPDTRPIPRPPAPEVVAGPAAVEPEDPAALAPVEPVTPVAPAPPIENAPEGTDAPQVVAPVPQSQTEAPPLPRPQTAEAAQQAEALARILAGQAQEIVASSPGALAPVDLDPEVTHTGQSLPQNVTGTAPTIATASVPNVSVSVSVTVMGQAEALAPMSAILLPVPSRAARPLPEPALAIARPAPTAPDLAPVLSRPRPHGPEAQEVVHALSTSRPASVSAVLLPRRASATAQAHRARLILAAAPAIDPFPASALPPGSLPDGPESLARAIQPPAPLGEATAAVLIADPRPITGVTSRLDFGGAAVPLPPAMPARGPTPISPEAPIRLPDPNPQALARMINDAMICWRLADLNPEARWAEISVDVALDDTNMPARASIRLTGFRGVVSGAAADAYRAAQGALAGCAEATLAAPATESVTLMFDRTGIRLR